MLRMLLPSNYVVSNVGDLGRGILKTKKNSTYTILLVGKTRRSLEKHALISRARYRRDRERENKLPVLACKRPERQQSQPICVLPRRK